MRDLYNLIYDVILQIGALSRVVFKDSSHVDYPVLGFGAVIQLFKEFGICQSEPQPALTKNLTFLRNQTLLSNELSCFQFEIGIVLNPLTTFVSYLYLSEIFIKDLV